MGAAHRLYGSLSSRNDGRWRKAVPVDDCTGKCTDFRPTFQRNDGGPFVASILEAVDSQYPLDGLGAPCFPSPGALIDSQFGHLVVAGRRGRKNFRYSIRGATHAPLIQSSKVIDDEDVAHAMIGALPFSGCPQRAPAAARIKA